MAEAEQTDQLSQLGKMTEIVADTGEIELIKKFKPLDATTNPSLIFKAAQLEEYEGLVTDAIKWAKDKGGDEAVVLENIMDKLAVNFGTEILKHVEGVVSTEIDARLSFNTAATVEKARKLIEMYKEVGIDARKRVLFKIASTWEGLKAMEILQKDGVNCNMTLLFSIWQAAAAAEFGAYLISPFVGRITDWHKAKNGWQELPAPDDDPGVKSVREIYHYYKHHKFNTIVMGASFRSTGQVLGLAGVDKLTVSPKLLQQMKDTNKVVDRILSVDKVQEVPKLDVTEQAYRWNMNEDPCAVEKLAGGIRRFAADTVKLENIIREKMK